MAPAKPRQIIVHYKVGKHQQYLTLFGSREKRPKNHTLLFSLFVRVQLMKKPKKNLGQKRLTSDKSSLCLSMRPSNDVKYFMPC